MYYYMKAIPVFLNILPYILLYTVLKLPQPPLEIPPVSILTTTLKRRSVITSCTTPASFSIDEDNKNNRDT